MATKVFKIKQQQQPPTIRPIRPRNGARVPKPAFPLMALITRFYKSSRPGHYVDKVVALCFDYEVEYELAYHNRDTDGGCCVTYARPVSLRAR